MDLRGSMGFDGVDGDLRGFFQAIWETQSSPRGDFQSIPISNKLDEYRLFDADGKKWHPHILQKNGGDFHGDVHLPWVPWSRNKKSPNKK